MQAPSVARLDMHPSRIPLVVPAGVPLRAPQHPGRFLDRCFLKPLALTQTEAAQRLGISRRRVNELVQGHRGISADTAIRCAMTFGVPAERWLAMQSEWDVFQAWKALRRARRASAPTRSR